MSSEERLGRSRIPEHPGLIDSEQPSASVRRGTGDATKLATGGGVALAGRVAGQGVQVLTQIVLARALGPGPFGLYALGWTLLRIGRSIGLLGLDKGVIRFGATWWGTDETALRGVFRQSILLSIVAAGVLGGGLWLAAPWLAEGVFRQPPELTGVLRWCAAALPLVVLLRVVAAATRVSQTVRSSVLTEDVLQPVAQLLLVAVALALGLGLRGALMAVVASHLLAVLAAGVSLARLFPGAYRGRARRPVPASVMLGFSTQASLGAIFTMLVLWVDRLMVGYFRPAEEVGVYQAASQIPLIFALVIGSFGTIFAPLVVEAHKRGEKERLQELYRVSTKWGLYLTLPIFLVLCFAPREVMRVLFGAGYELGWLPLIILAAGQTANAATGPVGQLLVMIGRQRRWFLLSGTMLVVNIGLDVLLIPRWGLTGAAVATSVSISALFAAGLLVARNSIGVWPYDRRYLKVVAGAAVAVASLVSLRWLPVARPELRLVLRAVVGVGSFLGVLATFALDSEEREVIGWLRHRMSRRWGS